MMYFQTTPVPNFILNKMWYIYGTNVEDLRDIFYQDTQTIADKFQSILETKYQNCNGRCYSCGTSKFFCHSCSRVNKKICRGYHMDDPLDELIGRLVFEVINGICSPEDITSGMWLDPSLRDPGHHNRIYNTASKVAQMYGMLPVLVSVM